MRLIQAGKRTSCTTTLLALLCILHVVSACLPANGSDYPCNSTTIYEPTSPVRTRRHPLRTKWNSVSRKPFLVIGFVVSGFFAVCLVVVYIKRFHGNLCQRTTSGNSGQHTELWTVLPPLYEDVVKESWTASKAGRRVSGATPPPSYDEASKTFPFPSQVTRI